MSENKKLLKGRGKDPNFLTKLILCARAGGRCQFEGCNEKLFIEGLTFKELNKSNIAHIVAASPEGPRGSEDSYELSDKIDNLMLMCQEHHKLIDDYPEQYTVAKLIEMKKYQEERVERILDAMNYPEAEIVMFEALIKNKVDVKIDFKQAVDANRSEGNNPASGHGILIRVECTSDYRSKEYWKNVVKQLEDKVRYQIESLYQYNHDLKIAVFPLAPIPLIIKLGNLLGDKKIIDIFQKTRVPDTWKWQSKELTNEFQTEKIIIKKGKNVALILSLTAEINFSRIRSVFDVDIIYHLKAKRNGVDCIKSLDDLKRFWQEFQVICDRIKNEDSVEEISLFPSIPVSAAFEIGRRYMPGIYPRINIYDDDNGFFKTIIIGGNINE